jgi:hypothetical protein
MHDPYHSRPLVPPAVDEADADAFDRIIAYLIDIEARAALLRERYPETPVIPARLETIAEPAGARALLQALGLEWTDAAAAVCTRRANARPSVKRLIDRPVDLDYCRERLERYLARAHERALPIPEGIGD